MSRIRLNQELRNKCGSRFKVHFEAEDTQEKEDFFQKRENFKPEVVPSINNIGVKPIAL